MKTVLNAVILALSVICLTAYIVYARNITLETPTFSKYTVHAIAFGWAGLYLLKLWKESEVERNG